LYSLQELEDIQSEKIYSELELITLQFELSTMHSDECSVEYFKLFSWNGSPL